MKSLWVFEGLNNDRPDIKYFLEKYMDITPNVLFWDTTPTWYCDSVWEDRILSALEQHGSPDIVLGASMGGFGALLFQPIIKAKKVIAFGPQADVRYDTLITLPDENYYWAKRMETYRGKVLPTYTEGDIDIYFGYAECDKFHRDVCIKQGYNVIDIDCSIHCAFTHLFEQNELEKIIRDTLC
jgi:hypothetical protein